ncbi:hypothetical protein BDZ85DRAFT_225667, partial [Elsinoe ampelina]
MRLAVARWTRLSPSTTKTIRVSYAPGVPTAEANFNGDLRFGANRGYMNERTALHEISHTLGIGQTGAFDARCSAGDWPRGNALVAGWDGQGGKVNCGGGHVWPYGLNYDTEWSEVNAERHVRLIVGMIGDGL